MLQSISFAKPCKHCGSNNIAQTREPEDSVHFGRYTCLECNHWLGWVKKPRTQEPQISVTLLLQKEGLESWEKSFLRAIALNKKFSKAETIVLQKIDQRLNPL